MNYRLYLLGKLGQVRAIESVTADDDIRAIGIAQSLLFFCCDDFDRYQVWNTTTMVADD